MGDQPRRLLRAPRRRSHGGTSAALALWALGLAAGACDTPPALGHQPIRVAAAADLTNAFAELGRQFKRDTGVEVLFTFGSTGLLARQLRERAPFDMFAAASASFVDDVVRQGVCDGRTRALYGRGRLALWQRPGSAKGTALEGLRAPAFKRIALANPEHAPYGTAAREALITAGLWTELEPRLVYGENVRQTLQLAESGNVEAALVALSLVIDDRAGTWQLVDEQLHQPIDQELVACSAGNNRAGGRRFAAYVSSAGGRASMKRFGFLLPGESLVSAQ